MAKFQRTFEGNVDGRISKACLDLYTPMCFRHKIFVLVKLILETCEEEEESMLFAGLGQKEHTIMTIILNYDTLKIAEISFENIEELYEDDEFNDVPELAENLIASENRVISVIDLQCLLLRKFQQKVWIYINTLNTPIFLITCIPTTIYLSLFSDQIGVYRWNCILQIVEAVQVTRSLAGF